jgi:lauroyl/myristoyl acyltransferase
MSRWLPGAIASLAYHASGAKRRLSEQHVALVFDGKISRERVQELVKYSFHEFWSEAFSIPCPIKLEPGLTRVEFRGLEHLQRALENGRGAIFWESNSFGRRFLAKQALYQNGFAVHQVYGDNHAAGFASQCPASWIRRRIINRFFEECERNYVAEILDLPLWEPMPVMRVLFDRLRENALLCVAGNGTLGWQGIRKHFLCTDRVFFTGMVSLSRISGAPILPLFCVQEKPGIFAVVIEPPISEDACADRDRARETCIDRYVALLESYVKKYPEQYSSWHALSTPNITLPAEEERR